MINIGSPKSAYTPPRPNVTASTLAPLSGARGNMSQLQSSLAYQQAGREGKERMEQNLGAGRPVDVFDVGRYEKDLEERKKLMETTNKKPRVDPSFLSKAKSNFETNVY
jgi:hypothetical protein